MSSPLPVSSTEIGDLIVALNRLSLALESHSSAGSVPASSVPLVPDCSDPTDSPWILVEEAESLPKGYRDERVSRIVEDGPGPTPQALISLGKSRLTGVDPGYELRVRRAYVAGFWAWASLATSTEYSAPDPIGLPDSQFLVLRAWTFNPRLVQLPIRVRTKTELSQLLGPLPAPGAIVQGFASLTEVQVFCGGANIPVPPLFQWRAQRKA